MDGTTDEVEYTDTSHADSSFPYKCLYLIHNRRRAYFILLSGL